MEPADGMRAFRAHPAAEMLSDAEIERTFVDPGGIEEFWRREYLRGFVDRGGGKIKFLRGGPGAGKTHLLAHLGLTAARDGFLAARVDAHADRLASIDELYRAVARTVDWDGLFDRCALSLIRNGLGYRDYSLSASEFRSWAESAHGLSAVSLMTDIRHAADHFVKELDICAPLREPVRAAVARRTGTEAADDGALFRWLRGERLTRPERRGIVVPANVDARNARAMLLSLAVLARAASYRGLLILVDRAEVMAHAIRQDGVPYYTRGTREQAYEMWRELIDGSHLSPYMFAVVAGGVDLFENQKNGLQAYQALWHRIQPEIETAQANRFHDIVDLDRMWRQGDDLARLAERWAASAGGVELNGRVVAASAGSYGLDWASPRTAVFKALPAAMGDV